MQHRRQHSGFWRATIAGALQKSQQIGIVETVSPIQRGHQCRLGKRGRIIAGLGQVGSPVQLSDGIVVAGSDEVGPSVGDPQSGLDTVAGRRCRRQCQHLQSAVEDADGTFVGEALGRARRHLDGNLAGMQRIPEPFGGEPVVHRLFELLVIVAGLLEAFARQRRAGGPAEEVDKLSSRVVRTIA